MDDQLNLATSVLDPCCGSRMFWFNSKDRRAAFDSEMAAYLRGRGHSGWTDSRGRLRTNIAPDGPRYKALGNSMAVNCMRWIGQRIEMVERAFFAHSVGGRWLDEK